MAIEEDEVGGRLCTRQRRLESGWLADLRLLVLYCIVHKTRQFTPPNAEQSGGGGETTATLVFPSYFCQLELLRTGVESSSSPPPPFWGEQTAKIATLVVVYCTSTTTTTVQLEKLDARKEERTASVVADRTHKRGEKQCGGKKGDDMVRYGVPTFVGEGEGGVVGLA